MLCDFKQKTDLSQHKAKGHFSEMAWLQFQKSSVMCGGKVHSGACLKRRHVYVAVAMAVAEWQKLSHIFISIIPYLKNLISLMQPINKEILL